MYRWNTLCPYRDGRNNLSGDIKRRGTSVKRLLTEMKNNLLESKDFKGVDMQTIMEKTHPSMKHM